MLHLSDKNPAREGTRQKIVKTAFGWPIICQNSGDKGAVYDKRETGLSMTKAAAALCEALA
jgi:hypothetical protein